MKLLIADDHVMLAESVSEYLEKQPGVESCLVSRTLAETKELLATEHPDVLLLDIAFPDGDGIDAIPELRKQSPQTKIVMLTMYAEENVIRRALDKKVNGYVLKSGGQAELQTLVDYLQAGEDYICKEAKQVLGKKQTDAIWLSPREREVLRLLAEGKTTKEIANQLFLSFETVHSYTKYLRQKLGVQNVAALVRVAMEQHLC